MHIGAHVPNTAASEMYGRFRSYVAVEADVCAFFERHFLIERGWRAAVVSEELSPAEASNLASTCRRYAYEKAWALDVDHFDPGLFYEIDLDSHSLSALEDTFVVPSYLIVEEKERFMLISDSDYYWEVAGPEAFLEDLFRKSLDVVDREFMDATRNYRRSSSRIGLSLSRIAAEAMGKSILIT